MQRINSLATLALLASAILPATFSKPQRFTGTGPRPLPAGMPLNVEFNNPNLPNSTITVKIRSQSNPDEIQTIEMVTDQNGYATKTFTPPIDWAAMTLTHPTSGDYTVPVTWE